MPDRLGQATRDVDLGDSGAALLAAPLAAEGQPAGNVPRIGYLEIAPAEGPIAQAMVDAFRRGMREHGYAVDREEFDEDFCCVAAPVTGEHGELRGIVGLSASTRAFDSEHDELASAVLGVAAEASLTPVPA